jgi:hypothetical protein
MYGGWSYSFHHFRHWLRWVFLGKNPSVTPESGSSDSHCIP